MNILWEENRQLPQEVADKLKEGAEICVKGEGIDPANVEVSLSFVEGEEIQELNKLYRGTDKVTDVLSFPQYSDLSKIDNSKPLLLGDVVICGEQALIQADEFGHSPAREIIYLFIHSMFHLLGYDHLESEDKKLMRLKEEEIMKKLDLER
ncbi:MAG: rRNA maturation RNase YbeY [Anaerovoracaceae bacterium]